MLAPVQNECQGLSGKAGQERMGPWEHMDCRVNCFIPSINNGPKSVILNCAES